MKTQGGFLISQIKQTGSRIFEQMLRESGISEFNGAQGKILYVLWENGELSITRIAKLTSLAKTTLTSMLERMEEQELITRSRNIENRREIIVNLTPKAALLRGEYDAVSDRINEIYYRSFRESDVQAFEKALRKILNNLTEYENGVF